MGKTYDVDIVVDARARKQAGLAPAGRPVEMETQTAVAEAAKETQTVMAEEAKETQTEARRRSRRARKVPRPGDSDASESSSGSDSDCEECLGLQPWSGALYSPSASYRQVDVVCGSHQYTISGFSMARSMGCGTRLCSDFFEVCGQLFRLEVYPGGFTADTRKYVSVFLTTPGTTNPNHVLYEIAILDQSGRDRHIVEKRGAYDGGGGFASGAVCMHGPLLSHNRGVIAALPKFIKARFLDAKAKRYMPCDMLCFRVTVQILQGWSSMPMVHYHASYGTYGRPPAPAAPLTAAGVAAGMPQPFMPVQLPGFTHVPGSVPPPGMPAVSPAVAAMPPPHAAAPVATAVAAPSMPGTVAPGASPAMPGAARPVQGVPQPAPGVPLYASPVPHGMGMAGFYSGALPSAGLAVPQHASPVRPNPVPPQYLMQMTSPQI